ncbi:hypothetical protein PAXRUDRAFT_34429 [Paxillus rubicundulus Ve08.2h10]|uniref:Unplaced genomic scaffold scaffold_437, whole genome shotgun sequence n=1 Tax=Paxillus rubicundulus Ve08.2h10 TaxID=930991 RepID=A0A0D0DM58_9AGAM|nr:hypothetical protein PAXRUDRAFT_34429 [Paxillus rubicundulus Ve08.2h10]
MASSTPSPLVSFPTASQESALVAPLPVPHLPFRRISLPSAPSLVLAQRQSVVSLTPSGSLAEDQVHVHQHRRARRRSLNPAGRSHRQIQADDDRQAKRAKIIAEFYATEKSYLDGLDLVYNHFLMPILQSLDAPKPLLARNEITTLFSNFIDIWNFHHTFFAALSARLYPSPSMSSPASHTTPLSSLLLAHFPYLSLYTPFIMSFPTSLAFLISLSHPSTINPAFATFLRTQESHSTCAHLRLADYLLTPVQRCPRYLLLLKDLLNFTDPEDPERERLQEVCDLVEKITTSLNTSLASHAQALSLISMQRNARDLPPTLTPLIAPGRKLIKRGALIRSGGEAEGGARKAFEFLLLSDYLLWLEREDTGVVGHDGGSSPRKRRASINVLGGGDEEKWWCRGSMNLVDMEVVMVVDRPGGSEERLEVLSPEGSFALYPGSPSSTAEDANGLSSWIDAIRTARTARLIALAMSNPDSTLSASTSGVHLRRALRAFASGGDDSDSTPGNEEPGDGNEEPLGNQNSCSASTKSPRSRPRRGQLDNFLPPVWIPDTEIDACMRCGRLFGFVLDLRLGDVFGWGFGKGGGSGAEGKQKPKTERDGDARHQGGVGKRTGGGGAWRRKHHCRLCGRVVCAACSGRTFHIASTDSDASPAHNRQKRKAARACDECYEAAFPLVSPSSATPASLHQLPPPFSAPQASQTPPDLPSTLADDDPPTICGIQPWLSITSHQGAGKDVSEALMAMDLGAGAIGLSRSSSRVGLSGSPSRVGLNPSVLSSSSSRKSRLSTSPSKPSGLRDINTHIHTQSASGSPSPSKRVVQLPRITFCEDEGSTSPPPSSGSIINGDASRDDRDYVPVRPIRIRPSQTRPRSYHDILEDFSLHERGPSMPSSVSSAPGAGLGSVREGEDEDEHEHERGGYPGGEIPVTPFYVQDDGGSEESQDGALAREDTARRRKRFSLPAVALQTAPVFAPAGPGEGWGGVGFRGDDIEGGNGGRRRLSLGHGGSGKEKKKKGEGDSSAAALLMDVLMGKTRHPGRK